MEDITQIEDLQQLAILGYKVQIKILDEEFIGEIIHYNPQLGVLILKERNHLDQQNYRLINANVIQELNIYERHSDIKEILDNIEQRKLDIDQILKYEEQIYENLNQKTATSEQELKIRFFNILLKTYSSSEWNEENIYISDVKVTIQPPYKESDVFGENAKAVERVKKIVSTIHKKLRSNKQE